MSRLEEIEYSINWTETAMVSPHWTEYCMDCNYLLSELHRLRAAIEKHKKWHDDYEWEYGEGDEELYKALEVT